ncbi:leucine-rich repeat-containing protein 15-like isoform X1 [Centruroides vittatus]|uniref:leucine-rich repeat-containing protein 15-like isoform X1 n=2 Tax=Centruroides vittatus TaxID=120091 RepID=UPI003510BC91
MGTLFRNVMSVHREILLLSVLSILPYASSDCLEFWKQWRTCPPDLFGVLSDLLCFHQINNTDQAVMTKSSPKQAGIVCHTNNFPITLFNCLPLENTTSIIFTNCPFPLVPLHQFFHDETLQQLDINFNKVQNQDRPLIINGYPVLEMIKLQTIYTMDYFDLQLGNLPSLQTLIIYVYNFTEMPRRPFQNVPRLHQLLISEGPLKTLPDDFFHGITNFTEINLSVNRLKIFQVALLKDASNLIKLNLSHNYLTELDQELFQPTKNLEHLYLDNNRITALPEDIFRTLISLKFLMLNNNNISELHENIFHYLRSLQILSLERNNIESLPENLFASSGSLIWMDLQHNRIRTLPENLFKHQTILHHLDLSDNQITEFNSLTPFGFSNYLFRVNISRNRLKEVPNIRWQVYNISNVDLSHNLISSLTFPEGLFQGCVLDLRYNQVHSVPDTMGLPPDHVFSYRILVEGNPFKCNCTLSTFVKALRILPIRDQDALECDAPWFHKYEKVLTLNEESLCLNDILCPVGCECAKTRGGEVHINCSNVARTHTPTNLPARTTTLNLDNNSIAEVSLTGSWSELRHLSLSNNLLLSLNEFVPPRALKTLAVDGNRLSDLPQSLMDHVEAIEDFKIYLADNAWICNCHAVSLKKWFMRNLPKIQDSMRTYCLNSLLTGERSLLVETRVEEFVCSSSVRNTKSFLLFITVFILLLCK